MLPKGVTQRLGAHFSTIPGRVMLDYSIPAVHVCVVAAALQEYLRTYCRPGQPFLDGLKMREGPKIPIYSKGINMSCQLIPADGPFTLIHKNNPIWAYWVWNDTLPTYNAATFERSWTLDLLRRCPLYQVLRTFYLREDLLPELVKKVRDRQFADLQGKLAHHHSGLGDDYAQQFVALPRHHDTG